MVMGDMEITTDLLVVGSGPGGYSAAIRGAELGLDVIVVDQTPRPGGGWLHHGCIPSQCLLHLGAHLDDRKWAETAGINSGEPVIDIDQVTHWKNQRIDEIATRLESQVHRLGILLIQGRARFDSSSGVRLEGAGISRVRFKHAVIATGSRQHLPRFLKSKPGGRIMDLEAALSLPDIPRQLLVTGGDFVSVELAQLYGALGSSVSFATSADCLLPGVDPDLAAPVEKKLSNLFTEIFYNAHIAAATEDTAGVTVDFSNGDQRASMRFDRLVITGYRRPNTDDLGLENTTVNLDSTGYILCNDRQQTSDKQLFAAGDVTITPMHASTAIREGRVAAEAATDKITAFDVRVIPTVIHTIPEISWCGLTVKEAETDQLDYLVQKFPWKQSARGIISDQANGLTKILTEPGTGRILGAGIVGRTSSELISEAALAIEMGALVEDLSLTLHPHPTFSETLAGAAETDAETAKSSAPTSDSDP